MSSRAFSTKQEKIQWLRRWRRSVCAVLVQNHFAGNDKGVREIERSLVEDLKTSLLVSRKTYWPDVRVRRLALAVMEEGA
jgi:hypothetical protein